MNTVIRAKLPIKELFSILDIDHIEYETPVSPTVSVNIESPTGYIPIRAFVKKLHNVATYALEDGRTVSCSVNHLVFENGEVKPIKDCTAVDTTIGPVSVIGVNELGEREVYDVSLDAPHQYLTPNGVIHHNTTLAKILVNEIGIEDYDVLEINASRTNSVEDVRDKITNFVSMMPFGPFKVVLLDEADYLTPNAQAALRGVMEEYHSTARFILTCNYPNRIIPALHSRCQGFHIEKTDQTEFTARVATILVEEGVDFELDTLDNYVKATYPDLRKCINLLQQNVQDGVLVTVSQGDSGEADWKFDMVELFKAGKINDARKLLCGKLRAEEMEEVYTWLYNNLEVFGDTEKQDKAVLIIKQGLVDHTLIADPEINLAATLIKLSRL